MYKKILKIGWKPKDKPSKKLLQNYYTGQFNEMDQGHVTLNRYQDEYFYTSFY